jgi:hypothetical protein
MDFTYRLLAETGVAVAPGVDFDPADGGRFVRLSFAGATDDIREAMFQARGMAAEHAFVSVRSGCSRAPRVGRLPPLKIAVRGI